MSLKAPFSSIQEYIQILQTRKLNYRSVDDIEHTPEVSIISAFYNDAGYFEDTYNSVINQTFQNYEWILVDDCSTDFNSIDIFNLLEQRNTKIKTFRHQQNQGPAAGRNKAVSHALGKYLFFLDTDDIIEPTYIEKCVLFLETHPEFSLVNSYSVGFQEVEYWWNKGFNTPNKFIIENLVTGRVLFKKTDFEKLGGYDENMRYGEDWDLWLKAFSNHQKAFTIPEYLDCYRRRKSGLSQVALQDNIHEDVKTLLQARYGDFFDRNHLDNIESNFHSYQLQKLESTIGVTNLLNYDAKKKRVFCLLPNLELSKENTVFLEFLKLLHQQNYSITISVVFDAKNELHSEFYKVTPDIFYLCNLFDYFDWVSFVTYIIVSRKISLFLIYNSIYIDYLLTIIKKKNINISFVKITYYNTEEKGDRVNTLANTIYSVYLDAQIEVCRLEFASLPTESEKSSVNQCHIYAINVENKSTFIKSLLDRIEEIWQKQESINVEKTKLENTTLTQASPDTLIWIQKYLSIKKLRDRDLNWEEELNSLNTWSREIEKERNIYKNQAQAWMRVAKLNQLDLTQAERELAQAQQKIDELISKKK